MKNRKMRISGDVTRTDQNSHPLTEPTCQRAVIVCPLSTTMPIPTANVTQNVSASAIELLASELDRTWPDAAGSLREGIDDTLTLMRLGIDGQLAKTLSSTNPCESMIEIVRYTQRNVKRWQQGDMRKRWSAAGMLVAEQQFRRIIGYRHLAKLVIAIERHTLLVPKRTATARRTASPLPSDHQPVRTVTEVPRRSGQPPSEAPPSALSQCHGSDRSGA